MTLRRLWLETAVRRGWTPREARILIRVAEEGGLRYAWAPPCYPIRRTP